MKQAEITSLYSVLFLEITIFLHKKMNDRQLSVRHSFLLIIFR